MIAAGDWNLRINRQQTKWEALQSSNDEFCKFEITIFTFVIRSRMIRTTLLLIFFGFCSKTNGNLATTCDVYEQESEYALCANGADAAKCNEYCKDKFGGEFVAAECSPERPNNERECICKLKCCNQLCWGPLYCVTCDGVKFGYHGMKKHYLLKPVTDYPNIHYFTITRTTKPWRMGPKAVLDTSELIVRDWELAIEVKAPDGPTAGYVIKINGDVVNLPHRWSKFDGHRELFVNIVWGNVPKTHVILITSFGLRERYTTVGAGVTQYTHLFIDTPRHPELKNHMHGLLGRWNGDPSDDSIDATGKKQTLDMAFSWAFGDSWIVPVVKAKNPQPKDGNGAGRPKKKPLDGDDSDEDKPKRPAGKKPNRDGSDSESNEGVHEGRPKHTNRLGKTPKHPRSDEPDADDSKEEHGAMKRKNAMDDSRLEEKQHRPRDNASDGDGSDEDPLGDEAKGHEADGDASDEDAQ